MDVPHKGMSRRRSVDPLILASTAYVIRVEPSALGLICDLFGAIVGSLIYDYRVRCSAEIRLLHDVTERKARDPSCVRFSQQEAL